MELKETINILKALADSSRLLIINALLEKPCYVEELAQRLNLSMSTVSFHLKKLEEANLIEKEKQQYYVMYSPIEHMFSLSLENLVRFANPQQEQQRERLDKYAQKIINSFFKDGRLQKLPTQYKKRMLLLEMIATTFEKHRDYEEKEVNELLSYIYDDYCTLRRLLVDEGFMVRAGGRYRLIKTEPDPDNGPEKPVTMQDFIQITSEAKERYKMNTKKELKKKYLDNPPPMGIFQIKNTKNNKVFIGYSENLPGMINRYRFLLKLGNHRNKTLQEDWNNFGSEAFTFEILDILEPGNGPEFNPDRELAQLKEMWLEKLEPYDDRGYNTRSPLSSKKYF